MDDIVEQFLLEKLDDEIKGARTKSRCTKLHSIHNVSQEVKVLMENKTEGTRAAVKETRREKLYYLLNLMTEWRDMKNQSTALLSFDEILRKLKQVKKELEEKPEEATKEQQACPDPQVYRWSSHEAALAEIHGFGDKLMIMEHLLCNNGSKAVGIVGVAGVGKTELCRKAYNHPPVWDHFPLRIWLCLSKHQKMDHLSFEDQLKRMLSCLGFEDPVIQKVGVEKLGLALRRQLTRGRYLVVLDDVWMVEENGKVVVEKEIRKLFSFLTPYEGTLLLTSRSPELEKMVGPNSMHRLLPLADDESCWKIFSDHAFKVEDDVKGEELEKLKRSILDKCDGLPLMAKMLGKIGNETKPKTTPPNLK